MDLKKIAFFDFDGTMTSRDSFLDFIRHERGLLRFGLGMFLHIPLFIGMYARLFKHQFVKERLLQWFYKGIAQEAFMASSEHYAMEVLPAMIRPKSMAEIFDLKEHGFEIVVVTASPTSWVEPWCALHQIKVIGSVLEFHDERVTGKLIGKNCRGLEKVRRVKAAYDLSTYDTIYCYGDTEADIPLLLLATHSFYRPFR